MSGFNALRAVTDTLATLIETDLGITVDKDHSPHALSGDTALLSVYLYRVEPNPFLANLEWQSAGASQLVAPPLGLNLHYLFTPYGPDQPEIQRTLGELLRLFHEQPVIRVGHPALSADLATMTEELRITPHALPFADLMDLWKSFYNVPYRLSVVYEVSAVLIDSRETRNVTRVQERHVELGMLR